MPFEPQKISTDPMGVILLTGPGESHISSGRVEGVFKDVLKGASVHLLGNGKEAITQDMLGKSVREAASEAERVLIIMDVHGSPSKGGLGHVIAFDKEQPVLSRDVFRCIRMAAGDKKTDILSTACFGGGAAYAFMKEAAPGSKLITMAPAYKVSPAALLGEFFFELEDRALRKGCEMSGSMDRLLCFLVKIAENSGNNLFYKPMDIVFAEAGKNGGVVNIKKSLEARIGKPFSPQEKKRIEENLAFLFSPQEIDSLITSIENPFQSKKISFLLTHARDPKGQWGLEFLSNLQKQIPDAKNLLQELQPLFGEKYPQNDDKVRDFCKKVGIEENGYQFHQLVFLLKDQKNGLSHYFHGCTVAALAALAAHNGPLRKTPIVNASPQRSHGRVFKEEHQEIHKKPYPSKVTKYFNH